MMHNEIVITPMQIGQWLLLIAGAIITIGGAIKIVVGWIRALRSPNVKQDKAIEQINARLDKGDRRFEADDSRLKKLEDSMNLMLESQFALLDHALEGNNRESLKEAKHDMYEYLRKGATNQEQ